MIVDLTGFSIDDSIPSDYEVMSYITVDTAIQLIMTLGQRAFLAKLDVKMPSTFCQYITSILTLVSHLAYGLLQNFSIL